MSDINVQELATKVVEELKKSPENDMYPESWTHVMN